MFDKLIYKVRIVFQWLKSRYLYHTDKDKYLFRRAVKIPFHQWLNEIQKVPDVLHIPLLNKMSAIQIDCICCGRRGIHEYWTGNHDIIKDFSDQFVKNEAEKMMKVVIEIATSIDPLMANREMLANCIIEYATLQVLIIDPPPAEDESGLRGQPGITGELKAHLFELAQKDKTLREFMHAFDTPKNWDDVWNPVLLRYRIAFAQTHVYYSLRQVFDDINHADEMQKDWFKPYLAAMCAWAEHQYRESLGMLPSLGNDIFGARLRALEMSLFTKCVMSGARYPDIEWQNMIHEIEHGDKANPT
jgi:hypothetical protein